ncbi:hypothetical protein B9G99_04565 [Kushneria konosiri]|uniref:Uncharacterized protein n=1 Tax=Kushneria konosiri TaxID=698828 RepID=A0A2Z2HGA8_9GAMM|nr:hypothetical protein B9G99_04565 [Kushneria konosiri]
MPLAPPGRESSSVFCTDDTDGDDWVDDPSSSDGGDVANASTGTRARLSPQTTIFNVFMTLFSEA